METRALYISTRTENEPNLIMLTHFLRNSPEPALRSSAEPGRRRVAASALELAFPGHALKRLVYALDPVLVIGSVRRK